MKSPDEKYINELRKAIIAISDWLACYEGISIAYLAEQVQEDPSPELHTIQEVLNQRRSIV